LTTATATTNIFYNSNSNNKYFLISTTATTTTNIFCNSNSNNKYFLQQQQQQQIFF